MGLENIEVTQVQADELGEQFPSLAKKDFFEPVTPKKNFAFSELKNKVEETINANEPEPKDTLNKLLQEVSKPKTQSNETTTVNKAEEVTEENISALNTKNIKEKPENNSAADEILKADKKRRKAGKFAVSFVSG